MKYVLGCHRGWMDTRETLSVYGLGAATNNQKQIGKRHWIQVCSCNCHYQW